MSHALQFYLRSGFLSAVGNLAYCRDLAMCISMTFKDVHSSFA